MDDLKQPSTKLKALIAGTLLDLEDHRNVVKKVCASLGVFPIAYEEKPFSKAPLEACNAMVNEADILIGIIGFRYGHVPEGQKKSFTHLEFERALARDIPTLIYSLSNNHPVKIKDVETNFEALANLQEFKNELNERKHVRHIDSIDELSNKVTSDLSDILDNQLKILTKLKALLLLPYNEEMKELKETVRKVLKKNNVDPIVFDDVIYPGARWANAITNAIKNADFIIADITSENPNVIYELGYAHALNKPTILLVERDKTRNMPSDLAGYQYLFYERGTLLPLADRLKRYIEMVGRRGK
jgi:hypothetical protein